MSTLNSLFPRGTTSEQDLVESLIIESIRQYGQDFFYVPRTLVALDTILGEDSLSKFNDAYPIEGYIDNADGFAGQGAFASKFGMFIEEQAQITISRARWKTLVGDFGTSLLPERPTEGDLLYFPKTSGLFEIKFVEHQNPFYQIGRLYVYKLKVELFQYSSERIETDITELNQIALDMTFDIKDKLVPEANPAKRDFFTNTDIQTAADAVLNFDESNPFGN